MSYTAFPGVEERLRELITRIDVRAFREEGSPACAASSCRVFGLCCSLTVAVTAEEVCVITGLIDSRPDLFSMKGIRGQGRPFRTDPATGRKYIARQMRPFSRFHALVQALIADGIWDTGLLKGFLRVCVFSMADGSCALQNASVALGRHKWYYKPVNCWKYPLDIANDALTLTGRAGAPFFPCRRGEAVPAEKGLAEELAFLGKILGRDILREIAARK